MKFFQLNVKETDYDKFLKNENFNYLFGKTFYDGIAIFPTGGLKFEF